MDVVWTESLKIRFDRVGKAKNFNKTSVQVQQNFRSAMQKTGVMASLNTEILDPEQ